MTLQQHVFFSIQLFVFEHDATTDIIGKSRNCDLDAMYACYHFSVCHAEMHRSMMRAIN